MHLLLSIRMVDLSTITQSQAKKRAPRVILHATLFSNQKRRLICVGPWLRILQYGFDL